MFDVGLHDSTIPFLWRDRIHGVNRGEGTLYRFRFAYSISRENHVRNVTRRDNVVTYVFTLCRVIRFFPSPEDQAADSPDTRISRGTDHAPPRTPIASDAAASASIRAQETLKAQDR